MSALAKHQPYGYRSPVTVNPVADLGRSNIVRRTSAHHPIAGAFFVPAASCYGGCAWDTFGCAGCLTSRSANPRTAATILRLAANGGSSTTLGAVPMKHTRNSSTHAAAWKARALAALRADSSLSARLARYNAAMARAREIEVRANAVALQIRPVGGMWRVCQGDAVLAFAASYRAACQSLAALEAVGGVQ